MPVRCLSEDSGEGAVLCHTTTPSGESAFVFGDLRTLFARANEVKSGDCLAGIAAHSERERVAAKCTLAEVLLEEILDQPLLDPDADDVSQLLLDTFDRNTFHSPLDSR